MDWKKRHLNISRKKIIQVLIIADGWGSASHVSEFLKAKGCSVQTTGDALTGMYLSLDSHFDAIIIDIILPGMSGITLCRRLREKGCNHALILMLLNHNSAGAKVASLEAGADDYLCKTMPQQQIEERLRVLFRLGSAHLQNTCP